MNGTERQFAWLNDERLAEQALSPTPAWLWSADGSRILWANPVAATIFDGATPAEASALRFEPDHPAARQIARLTHALPETGLPRLERLRGFGAKLGGTLMCMCSRIHAAEQATVLVIAVERAGKELALQERARRLLADLAQPAAIFGADGELIESKTETRARLGDARDLGALGAETLARQAMRDGRAEGDITAGKVIMLKLGAGKTVTLLMVYTQAPAPRAAPPVTESAPPVAENAAPTVESAPPVVESAPPVAPNPALAEQSARRLPLRFVWQMDAENRFTLGAQDFARLLGPNTTAMFDRPWGEIAAALALDPQGRVAAALAARDTWSGIVVDWPVDDDERRLPIELSALPVYDRDREFAGFRGFAICRDVSRLEELERRRATPRPAPPPPPAAQEPPPEQPAKVLPFPTAPMLSPVEHSAFQELARELGERLNKPAPGPSSDDFGTEQPFVATTRETPRLPARDSSEGRPILDRLPVGILVYRLNNLVYANRAFLDWAGHGSLDEMAEAGGLDSLYLESKDGGIAGARNGAKPLTISTVNGDRPPVEGRLFNVSWNNENALVLMINAQGAAPAAEPKQPRADEQLVQRLQAENAELATILDTATDGVVVLDRAGRVLSANRSAQALFGYDKDDITELSLGDLFAPESRRPLFEHLDRLARNGGPESFDAGREAIGLERNGGLVPLHITMGRINDGEKFCAVLRDITAWKRNEEELINAKQEAEKALIAKSEFLAKISHEIRTPLNGIIGFSEVMMEERFGPISNDRYRQYLKDIHESGGHLIALLNDLLDLSKIEAGKLELSFVSVNLNELVQQCVAYIQEQANRERVIIRTSLPAGLPPIVADARSVRQIALNVLANSIKFAGAGGQVIVSTALTDQHEVVLRVCDTGHGLSEKELQTALEPFRQLATAPRWGASGTGLALPITKALAEANHARFRITSRVADGTLVEVSFPATRVLAQ